MWARIFIIHPYMLNLLGQGVPQVFPLLQDLCFWLGNTFPCEDTHGFLEMLALKNPFSVTSEPSSGKWWLPFLLTELLVKNKAKRTSSLDVTLGSVGSGHC